MLTSLGQPTKKAKTLRMEHVKGRKFTEKKRKRKIKALLGMLARLPWGRRNVLGLMNGNYEGVYVKYASLIVSCHWIKVFITA